MTTTLPIHQIARLSGHNASIYALNMGLKPQSFLSAAGDGWIVEWGLVEPENGKLIAKVDTKVFSFLPLPEQQQLVVGNMEGGVHWVDLKKPEATRNIAHHKNGVFQILQIENQVLTFGGDGLLSFWDLPEGKLNGSIQISRQALRCASYFPEKNELAIGSSDHSIVVLDTESWTLKHRLQNAHDNSVFSISYTPDGDFLLSGGRDAMLKVWDAKAPAKPLFKQPAHWYTINKIIFHPSGRFFATASRDKTLKIWATQDFKLLKVLETVRDRGHLNSVNTLLWTPDGDTLISSGDDRSILLWDTSALKNWQF